METTARWIVGVDGSSPSHHALRWALAQATNRAVAITALQCQVPLEGWPDHPRPDEEIGALERRLDELQASIGPAASGLRTLAVRGIPVPVLLDHAETAELLVLGNRGLGGFQRLLLGSVGLQAATHSPIPVVIVPPSARLDGALDHVMVGVDASPNSEAALRWACSFARETTTIEAVGAWEPSVFTARSGAERLEELSASWHETLDRFIDDVLASSPSSAGMVTRSFDYSKPAEALSRHGAETDLLVVGARGRGTIASAILGSVSNTLLHRPPCPIVIVPGP
jgi:nucleotide-binding universal stress UspA family protein